MVFWEVLWEVLWVSLGLIGVSSVVGSRFETDMVLSGPPRVSQSGVELEKNFECDFMASEDAYGSYKTCGTVRLTFGPL